MSSEVFPPDSHLGLGSCMHHRRPCESDVGRSIHAKRQRSAQLTSSPTMAPKIHIGSSWRAAAASCSSMPVGRSQVVVYVAAMV